MKTDYIYDMPAGKEIDEMVAEKVMGWHKGHYYFPNEPNTDKEDNWLDAEGRYMYGIKMEDGWYEDDEDFHLLHWHPSESILWAEEVIEKMLSIKTIPHGYTKWNIVIESDGPERWIADFKDDPLHTTACSAPTIPLAICRAALLATKYTLK